MTRADRPTIVFAGGGHAHLYSLLRTPQLVDEGYDVVLVNPSRYLYYSGMATGVISRTYTPEEDRIDVRHLVERGGGRFIDATVEEVDVQGRRLILGDGRSVAYDAASFCLGSEVRGGAAGEAVVSVKPVANAESIRRRIFSLDGSEVGGDGPRVLVVGGGAAGCEVAANVLSVLEEVGGGSLTLTERGGSLLGGAPEKARRSIQANLESRGAEVWLDTTVSSYENGCAVTVDGRRLRTDLAVSAVGITPPGTFRHSGLLTGEDGGLWVDRYLRSPVAPEVFGGGDSVTFRGTGLPKLGVFAIRQGPVLFHNLRAVLRGEPLKPFAPQKRYLYVLNLGDGTGLGIYGALVWRGRSAMSLKRYVDKKFMGQFPVAASISEV